MFRGAALLGVLPTRGKSSVWLVLESLYWFDFDQTNRSLLHAVCRGTTSSMQFRSVPLGLNKPISIPIAALFVARPDANPRLTSEWFSLGPFWTIRFISRISLAALTVRFSSWVDSGRRAGQGEWRSARYQQMSNVSSRPSRAGRHV